MNDTLHPFQRSALAYFSQDVSNLSDWAKLVVPEDLGGRVVTTLPDGLKVDRVWREYIPNLFRSTQFHQENERAYARFYRDLTAYGLDPARLAGEEVAGRKERGLALRVKDVLQVLCAAREGDRDNRARIHRDQERANCRDEVEAMLEGRDVGESSVRAARQLTVMAKDIPIETEDSDRY